MTRFYLLPQWIVVVGVMVTAVLVILQTVVVTYGFRRLRMTGPFLSENILELFVLLHLFLLGVLLAEVHDYGERGFVHSGGQVLLRYLVFLALFLLSGSISWQKRLIWPLIVPVTAAWTLPFAEKALGRWFPLHFFLVLCFWFFRCIHLILLRRQERNLQLSAASVKEAVDTLDTGLLFCHSDGDILLQNSKMQSLMETLSGKYTYNGRKFYQDLRNGRVRPECRKGEMGSQLAYWLPDGTIWVFELYVLQAGNRKWVLLCGFNMTERWTATHALWQQEQALAQRNQELTDLLNSLETICRTEATIHAKSRVHDVLGQRISLLLRSLREHRAPDEELLSSFAQGLPKELTQVVEPVSDSLDTLVRAFQGLGVRVTVEGVLPGRSDAAQAFSEIAAEAVTNAVRHGYATEVRIRLRFSGHRWQMEITDNGMQEEGPFTYGGGLTEMQRKIRQLGGSFTVSREPGFCIRADIPEGETE